MDRGSAALLSTGLAVIKSESAGMGGGRSLALGSGMYSTCMEEDVTGLLSTRLLQLQIGIAKIWAPLIKRCQKSIDDDLE